jgi:predicted lysophospholipase L1 biosynthesis ABC-type transport system permease subunit
LDRLQKLVWDWFKPKLESPAKKGGTAALWLLVTSIFLILSFTTLQVASDPAGYADDVAGQRVLRTFMGHATIAFPGVPYLLGALNLDPLEWLKDPDMRSATVLGFRVMMLIVVFRAFWKLLGYTSPRILSRDNRRLEHEIAKLRKSGRHRYNQS